MGLIRTVWVIVAVLIGVVTSTSPVLFAAEGVETWEEKHKSEPYVMLLKDYVIKINKDYSVTETFHKRAKVQNEAGKSLGEISINYDKSREEISNVEAYTITAEGKKLGYEKIQDLNSAEGFAIYSDGRKKVITMANVVEGSIVEWKSTKVIKKPVIENHYYDHFHFTNSYPTKEMKYKIIAPKELKLFFKKQNTAIDPKVEIVGEDAVYTWEARNSDKVDEEEFMPREEDVHQIVWISTLTDWKQLSDWMWSLYMKHLKVSPEIKDKVKELAGGKDTVLEKVQAIIEYLRSDFRYVSMNIDLHNYEPHPAKEIFSNKYGDCKDLTLLAMTMLSEIGVKAWPVISSGNVELERERLSPMPFYFDHVFLFIEIQGKQYFTDVLLKGYGLNEVPAYLSENKVFVVNEQGGFFAELPSSKTDELTTAMDQRTIIRNDGTAFIDMNLVFSKDASISMRERFKKISAETKGKFFEAMETALIAGGKIQARNWENIDKSSDKIIFKAKFEHKNWVQYMDRMMIFGLPQIQRGTIFSASKRKHPFVFFSGDVSKSTYTYTFPSDYEVRELPKKISLETPFSSYSREYSIKGNEVMAQETSAIKRSKMPPEEYQNVKNFYDELASMTNGKVVIQKR